MRTLVMDGVVSRRSLDLRMPGPLAVPTPEVSAKAPLVVTKTSAATIDGVRRQLAPAPVEAVPIGGSEEELRQNWVGAVVANRYRWAGLMAAGLLLPLIAVSGSRLTSLVGSRGFNQAQASTVNAAAVPPIAKAQAAAPVVQTDPALQQLLHDFTATQAAPFGIVIKDLKTGITTTSSPDQVFTSASLYKLFVATTVYKRIDIGQMSLSDRTGSTGRNVADCLRVMINISDNDCGRALGAMIGWNKADGDLQNLGFKNTTLADPQRTSAADVALLLERLYKGTLVSPSSTQQFISLLKDQRINNRLPAGLPGGTVIAHKTGDLYGFVHDAGIVFGPKTDYLIVAASGPWPNVGTAPGAFADLSGKVFTHLNQ